MAASAACALALAGCSPVALEERTDEAPNAADAVRNANLQPRFPKAVSDGGAPSQEFKGFSFFASTDPATSTSGKTDAPAAAPSSQDGFTLNFENTPVANVAKAVLGDSLGLGYVVDPRAQGTITLSSGRPIAKKDMLFVLESALRANNLVLVHEGATYRIAPAADGAAGPADRAGATGSADPGYGLSVIPLQYVSGATISKLLEGFAGRPGSIRTDPGGRILLIVGSGQERQSAIDTIRSFDVDWMRGQSVGMYPVRNSEPEPIVAELEKIMDSGEAGLGQGLVKFQPVARQNAIMVVAARPELLRAAARWIERLDAPNSAGVKVYKARYGDAKQIAQVLNDIFVHGGSGGGADSAANQIAPGSASTSLNTTQRLTGGRPAGADSSASAGGAGAAGAQTAATTPFGGIPTAALSSAMSSAESSGASGSGGAMLPGVRITADAATNSVLIYASPESYRVIERALNQIDRPKAQVAIDVTIAEVTLNDQLNYGVQWYLETALGPILNTSSGQGLTTAGAPPGFNVTIGNGATPHAIINALHQLTDVKILSNPSLVVVDNQAATLEVGDQVPITTGSATVLSANNAVVNTVDYKNTGIILNVLPRVSPNDNVQLEIEQEISSVPQNSANLTPTISERKVKSTIDVVSGQMVLLAGLVSDTQTKTRDGIPLFDQLPVIGGAFGSTGKSTERTELIILSRPKVIHDGADASEVAEQLRAKMRTGRIDAVSIPSALNVLAKPLN